MSLMAKIAEAKERLNHIEKSFQSINIRPSIPIPQFHQNHQENGGENSKKHAKLQVLELQVAYLQSRVLEMVNKQEQDELIHQKAMIYATAKNTANAVLHSLFDQCSAAKVDVLTTWWETGVLPTRNGLKHWRVDAKEIRNDTGSTLLHAAVDVSIARPKAKLKVLEFLLDKVGFDINVQDLYGRTPLHVAAMGGYIDLVECLLARGCDPSIPDKSGLSALSLVRSRSKPHKDIVTILAHAESVSMKDTPPYSHSISPEHAATSSAYIRSMASCVVQEHQAAYTKQADALKARILYETHRLVSISQPPQQLDCGLIPREIQFDTLLHEEMPLFFDNSSSQVTRLDQLFTPDAFIDPTFISRLKVEAASYSLSMVSPFVTAMARAGASWCGVLLRLINAVREAGTVPVPEISPDIPMTPPPQLLQTTVKDLQTSLLSSYTPSPSCTTPTHQTPPPGNNSSTSSPLNLTHSNNRHVWHYAVLFKGATRPFPGTLTVEYGSKVAKYSEEEDVTRYFPLEDRLLIGNAEYFVVQHTAATQEIQFDRAFEGDSAVNVKAFLAGSCCVLYPPYIASKRIWEREPGNQFEDSKNLEQEMVQDYQFLDPESEYEVAVKLGPLPSAKEARTIVEEWKAKSREAFEQRICSSDVASCVHYCPQRNGHMLCTETMAAIGRDIAKQRLGRPTYSKTLEARAPLQDLQNRYRKSEVRWPGSPNIKHPHQATPYGPLPSRSINTTAPVGETETINGKGGVTESSATSNILPPAPARITAASTDAGSNGHNGAPGRVRNEKVSRMLEFS